MPVTAEKTEEGLLPYDQMKDQLTRELAVFIESASSAGDLSMPGISYERGSTQISFQIPPLTDSVLFDCLRIIRKHIENIRVTSFDDGHYAFQAMNRNMFKTDNMLDNIRFEFFSLVSSRCEISKKGNMTQEETNAAIETFKCIFSSMKEDPAARLRKLGATVMSDNSSMSWDYIAGYEEVKRTIRESIILPVQNPEVNDAIARMTRRVYESNRPRAILFEGPPGVGKTTVARIIAGDAGIPLIYVPIESIMSKWYGQSSQNLAGIFEASEDMGGAIIFLDEIDSLAGSRDQNMFEATRRVLSVLLRKLDGIDAAENCITIGATNRRGDLDHALISRFDQTITFPYPNAAERATIFGNYAQHLTEDNRRILGERGENLSGRNIKDICEFAERRWARKVLIKNMEPVAPPFEYYIRTLQIWLKQA